MLHRLTFDLPAELNGDQLTDELRAADVPLATGHAVTVGMEDTTDVLEVIVDVEELDEAAVRLLVDPVLAAHVPLPVVSVLTDAQKIAVLTAQLTALAVAVDKPEIVDSLTNPEVPGG